MQEVMWALKFQINIKSMHTHTTTHYHTYIFTKTTSLLIIYAGTKRGQWDHKRWKAACDELARPLTVLLQIITFPMVNSQVNEWNDDDDDEEGYIHSLCMCGGSYSFFSLSDKKKLESWAQDQLFPSKRTKRKE